MSYVVATQQGHVSCRSLAQCKKVLRSDESAFIVGDPSEPMPRDPYVMHEYYRALRGDKKWGYEAKGWKGFDRWLHFGAQLKRPRDVIMRAEVSYQKGSHHSRRVVAEKTIPYNDADVVQAQLEVFRDRLVQKWKGSLVA